MNETDVFINCPFSADYRDRFHAIAFAVIRSGFEPRCALEADNGGENRYSKICRIIRECRYGIHDVSYMGLYGDPDRDSDFPLPRFNMPFELGLFLGAHTFGGRRQAGKTTLILDTKPYRFQKFLSDIAGQDIRTYSGDVLTLIEETATWLRIEGRRDKVPGGEAMAESYGRFANDLPELCRLAKLNYEKLTFFDYKRFAVEWIANEEARNELSELLS